MNRYLLLLLIIIQGSASVSAQCWELVLDKEETGHKAIYKISYVNDSLMWISGQDKLLGYSTDNGETIQLIDSPYESNGTDINNVQFHDEQNGVINNIYISEIYYTEDGGDSWSLAEIYNADGTICEVFCTDPVFDMKFNDANEGWALQGAILSDPYRILYTTDGGKSWSISHEQYQYNTGRIAYLNSDTLILQASRNDSYYLYYSFDGGTDWSVKDLNIEELDEYFFLNSQLSWIGSGSLDSNLIYKSDDFWESYSTIEIASDTNASLSATEIVKFANEELGWALVPTYPYEYGGISVSTDGGNSWRAQNVDISQPWNLTIINDSVAFVGTIEGELYRYRGRPSDCGPEAIAIQDTTLYPLLSWPTADGCFDGYYLQLGSTPGGAELLAQTDVGLDTFYQVVEALPDSTEVYATVVPYNHVYGAAEACESSSFTTITCPPSPIVVDTGYCKGEYLLWGDSLIQSPGVYTFPAVRENGCDSTVMVNVVQYIDPVTPIDTAYCQGDDFYWQDSLLAGAGVYEFTYLAANGCDSTVILTLEELLLPESQLDTLLCEGQSYEGQDTTLTEEGIYYFAYPAANGCDSLVQLSLDMAPAYAMQLDTFFCEGEVFYWPDSLLEAPGLYEFAYQSSQGCDSTWQVVLELRDDVYTQLDTALAAGEPFNGIFYPNDTLLTFTHPASNGCDSIVQVQLDILSRVEAPAKKPAYRLYPNPAQDILHLESNKTIERLVLWNALGQEVPVEFTGAGTISLSHLAGGIYFLRMRIGGREYVERVVVE